MIVQVHTDHNLEGSARLNAYVTDLTENAFDHYSSHITRIEVHLGDENAKKGGKDDKRCMMEARVEGRQPMAVTHHADTLELAVAGAVDKLDASLRKVMEQMKSHRS